LLALLLGLAAVLIPTTPAFAAAGPPPSSMASMGDSISRGFNACGFYVDCPYWSFSTGGAPAVNSHYLRILAKNKAMFGHAYNDARSGARAVDMPEQAEKAVAQHVQYVTMLIGANDVCTRSEATMTTPTAFRADIDWALGKLKAGLPTAKIYLISVPDLRRLWAAGKDNANARSTWTLFGIRQSMLANPTSMAATAEARRLRVRHREIDFHAKLAPASAAYGPPCAFDGDAACNYAF